jgi:PAS domain S-box-containing protein
VKTARRTHSSRRLAALRVRLAEADETLRAIRNGEVDAVVVAGVAGDRVFTLEGAEHGYRMLIESMNEGALTLTAGKTILYANECFARMVKYPLEQVMGSSFRRFLAKEDRATLRSLLQRADKSGAKIQVQLKARDGTQMQAQISIRLMARHGFGRASIGMVVTDMTEARRIEELLRALTHRVVQRHENERGSVALELHDRITQLLCGVLFRSQALVAALAARHDPAEKEATKLREMISQTARAVELISRNLWPGVLDHLGLVVVLRDTGKKFAARTGVTVGMSGVQLAMRLPADAELALFRILQEALRNVEQHARARHVTVKLKQRGAFVRLSIVDDGVGFNPDRRTTAPKKQGGLGLLGMRERATYVGGALTIRSGLRAGTEIEAQVPLPPVAPAARRAAVSHAPAG